MFEKENGVNEIQQSEKSTSGQSDITTLNSSCTSKENSKIVQKKTHQIYIRNLPKKTEKTFSIGALHAKSWTSSVDEITAQKSKD